MNNNQKSNSEEKNEEKTPLIALLSSAYFWVLAFFAFLIAAAFFWKKSDEKVYKKALYTPYWVDKKTFSQWITLFCADIISKEDYAKCRKLPMSVITQIHLRLGEHTDETPVMSKKQIVAVADGSYHTLRKSIERFPDQYGITPSVFHSLNSFPPKIAAQILKCYQNGVKKTHSHNTPYSL